MYKLKSDVIFNARVRKAFKKHTHFLTCNSLHHCVPEGLRDKYVAMTASPEYVVRPCDMLRCVIMNAYWLIDRVCT